MNKAFLMGRFTKDPELRYTNTSNIPVCQFTIAVYRKYKKEDEERLADFINCVAWNKTAEFICKYFKKGSRIAIVGRIETRSWDDAEGKKHFVTEVIAEEVDFAGSKVDQQSNNSEQTMQQNNEYNSVDNDDDLPF